MTAFRRSDRTDAPYYLARYTERRGLAQSEQPSSDRRGGGTALVAYRNRVTEVNVPPPDEMPRWD